MEVVGGTANGANHERLSPVVVRKDGVDPVPNPATAGSPIVSQNEPIALIYRENDLYLEALPALERHLNALGYSNVRTISWPAGTAEEQIKEQLEKELPTLGSTIVVCDYTTARTGALNELRTPKILIDDAFTYETAKLFMREQGLKGWGYGDPAFSFKEHRSLPKTRISPEYLAKCGEAVSSLLRSALKKAEPDGVPERIDVLSGHFLEHFPFLSYLGYYDTFRSEFESGHSVVTPDRLNALRRESHFDEETRGELERVYGVPVSQPHEVIVQWIANSGYPISQIRTLFDYQEIRPEDYAETATIWVVGDRHLLSKESFFSRLDERFSNEPYSSKLFTQSRLGSEAMFRKTHLRFPMENLVYDLINLGLIDKPQNFSTQVIGERVAENLEVSIGGIIAQRKIIDLPKEKDSRPR